MTIVPVIRAAASVVLAGAVTALIAAAPIDGSVQLAPLSQSSKATPAATSPTTPGVIPASLPGNNKWTKRPSSELRLPVDPRTDAPAWSGRVEVKFRDDLKVRADLGQSQFVACADGRQIPDVGAVLRSHGASIRQAITRDPADLAALEARAAAKSGKEQPDLASMMYIDAPPGNLLNVARAFNDMAIVEWVYIEKILVPDGGNQNMSPQFGCGQNGQATNTGSNNCYTTGTGLNPNWAGRCSQLGGGPGCNNPPACDADEVQPECQYGCNNIPCCELVSDILPGCSDANDPRGWDAMCATYANIYCNGNVYSGAPPIAGNMTSVVPSYRLDPCFALRGPVDITVSAIAIQGTGIDLTTAGPGGLGITPMVTTQLMTYTLAANGTVDPTTLNFVVYPTNQSSDELLPLVASQAMPDPSLEGAQISLSAGCFGEHTFVGCSQTSCCVFICRNDPNCCTIEWDSACVAQALAATSLAPAPCTAPALPPAVFDPAAVPSPLVTAGPELTGRTRGYQAYTQKASVLGPADLLPAGVGPSSNSIFSPSVRVDVPTPANRADPTSNMGTLQFLVGGYRGGGYDLAGMELLAGQLGIAPAQARGQGVTVAVVEHAAYVNHEDLINRTTPEGHQTQVLIIQDPINPNHGTAVLGIIGAEDNGFGVTGIAPAAKMRFYPAVSREEGQRLASAVANAIIDMKEGDLINMSIGYGDGDTIPSNPTMYNIISVGSSVGIASIISAGNDASPVITVPTGLPEGAEDSGAVIVGACWPGFQNGLLSQTLSVPGPYPGNNYCRLNFSNFTNQDAELGGVVDCCAWGTSMTSTGYGDLFTGLNGSPDPLQVNKLRTYTAQFNGTSSAAPMITGLCARAQGFAKAYFGASLPPRVLRDCLANHLGRHRQCGMNYENPFFPGYPEGGSPFFGDIVPLNAGGQLAAIGAFPDAPSLLAYIVANTFGGAPVQFNIISGTLVAGNQFSLRQIDGQTLNVSAVRRRAGDTGQGYGPALLYPFTGATTDVQIQLDTVQSLDQINTIQVVYRSAVTAAVPVVQIIYLYNRVQARWKSVGWTSLGQAPVTLGAAPFGDPREYAIANGSGATIYARAYNAALAAGPYDVRHDLFVIGVNIDLMDAGGGGGNGGNP